MAIVHAPAESDSLEALLSRFEIQRTTYIADRDRYFASAAEHKQLRSEILSRFRKLATPSKIGSRPGLIYTCRRDGLIYRLHLDGLGFERFEVPQTNIGGPV